MVLVNANRIITPSFKRCIIYAGTQGGCRQLASIARRICPNWEPAAYTDGGILLEYLSGDDCTKQPTILLFKLLFDNIQSVSLAKRLREEFPEQCVIYVVDRIYYGYLLHEYPREYYMWPPFTAERVQLAVITLEEQIAEIDGDSGSSQDDAAEEIDHAANSAFGEVSLNVDADRVVIPQRQNFVVVKAHDILYIESEKRLVHVHTINGKISTYTKLGEFHKQLAENFIRCHQSYIVNFHHVKTASNEQFEFSNGMQIPIAQSRRSEVRKAMEMLSRRESLL